MTLRTQLAALQVLYRMAHADRPASRGAVAHALRVSEGEVGRVLAHLDRVGLVDAARVRLTLAGLAVAVARPALGRREPGRAYGMRRRAA